VQHGRGANATFLQARRFHSISFAAEVEKDR